MEIRIRIHEAELDEHLLERLRALVGPGNTAELVVRPTQQVGGSVLAGTPYAPQPTPSVRDAFQALQPAYSREEYQELRRELFGEQ